jgi:N-acetylglucosaminyldiphosphoundecaprenol N-acetyl-beta-D-mannosaminyltransferase
MKTVKIMSVDIAAVTQAQLLEEVLGRLQDSRTRVIGKVPSEFLVRSLRDKDFQAYLQATDFNVADGIGVLWAARFLTLRTVRPVVLRHLQILWQATYSLASLILRPAFCREPIPERMRGLTAFLVMMDAAQQTKTPVYFLGARPHVNKAALEEIRARYPDLIIAGARDGYSYDDEANIRDINESGAVVLIVALGSPKQEYWIRDNLSKMKSVRLAVGEGGTLNMISGDYSPAPNRLQALGLEWLWRLMMQRHNQTGGMSRARRVWNAVPVFIYHAVKYKLKHGPESLGQQLPA